MTHYLHYGYTSMKGTGTMGKGYISIFVTFGINHPIFRTARPMSAKGNLISQIWPFIVNILSDKDNLTGIMLY